MSFFEHEGQKLAYTEYGGGPAELTPKGGRGRPARSAAAKRRPVILIHGLLLSQGMDHPLALALAARGNYVVTLDLLGHGRSDRPRDMWRYSTTQFAEQVLALMDHLELEEAVVMGTSLGANAALEVACRAPERLRGMVLEMPVLDNALLVSALTFTPILVALTFGEPLMKGVQRVARAIPRALLPYYGNVVLDVVRQDPGPGGAVLQGLFFGRVAPHRSERRKVRTPTLIMGHRRDPVHPFSDAGMLAEELPHARVIEANSLVEMRLKPERLTGEVADFLDEVWSKPRARERSTRGASAAADEASASYRARPR
jgi:pimeloyl-ACP methyl ester carboxylesterase